jgi:hypothetical protein
VAEQLSLWDAPCFDTAPKRELPAQREITESMEDYDRRRTTEMAEKLGWPPLHIGPVHSWPGVTIPEGEDAWQTFLASERGIGVVMITLHKQLNPFFPGCIDGKTGLHDRPVEVINRAEERHRAYLLDLAEALDWPRISYWSAPHQRVIGPGRKNTLRMGCCGTVADVTEALERRMRGEPENRKRRRYEEYNDDDEERWCDEM